jgi:hypothetical protein
LTLTPFRVKGSPLFSLLYVFGFCCFAVGIRFLQAMFIDAAGSVTSNQQVVANSEVFTAV